MKTALLITMLAVSAMGQEFVVTRSWVGIETNYPRHHQTVTNIVEVSDAIIKAAITNGTVCRVRGGHMWEERYSGTGDGVRWHYGPPHFRYCKICNAKQKRVEKWEDEQ